MPISTLVGKRHVRILVVDNDPGVRTQLSAWLTAAGHDCQTAEAIDDALAVATDAPPDTAIVSVDLESGGGLSLARRLRHAEDVGMIFLTGTPSYATGVSAMRMGANDYLVKPCHKGDVLDAVARAEAWRTTLQRDKSARGLMQEALALARDRSRRVAQASATDPSQALQALTAALKARLPETLEHCRRVAQIAVRMGANLGLKGQALNDLEHAAMLHDVGKIAVADAVLDTDRPLTDAELEILRTHVTLGFQIVSEVPALRHLAAVVVATNERFDGSGFPAGLAGEDIPLGARIIAVADAWDTLTSTRREASRLVADAVNAELVRGAGADFDPDVVRAWLNIGEDVLCS